MQTLILKSDNREALKAIKALAEVLDIRSSIKSGNEKQDFELVKGVKIVKAKKKFNPKEMAGTLTDLNLEDASVIRKKAWTGKKAVY